MSAESLGAWNASDNFSKYPVPSSIPSIISIQCLFVCESNPKWFSLFPSLIECLVMQFIKMSGDPLRCSIYYLFVEQELNLCFDFYCSYRSQPGYSWPHSSTGRVSIRPPVLAHKGIPGVLSWLGCLNSSLWGAATFVVSGRVCVFVGGIFCVEINKPSSVSFL